LIGDVTCWDQSSIWYKAVVRADSPNSGITIGFNSSVGEGSVVLTELPSVETLPMTGFPPDTHIGHYVTIGAGCVLKSCRIDDLVEIGDKCVILQGALVEHHSMLEPGTVVLPYQRIPSGQKWGGNPAVFVADLTPGEKEHIQETSEKIHIKAKEHLTEFLPCGNTYVHLEELEKSHASKPTSG
jgi:gamma-carbonic anhydrase